MPSYVVTGPDGKKYRVTAPAGASQDEIIDRVRGASRGSAPEIAGDALEREMSQLEDLIAKNTAGKSDSYRQEFDRRARESFNNNPDVKRLRSFQNPPKKDDSRLSGFALGAMKPFDNLATLASKIPVVGPAVDDFGEMLGMDRSADAAEKNQRARENNTRTGYQFAGNVAGSLPVAALSKNPFVQGAVSTGVLTNSKEPDIIAAEMATGGLLGKGADMAMRAISPVIAPKVSKAVQTLTKRGVRPTPGQAVRESSSIPARMLTALEDRATSLPGPTGQAVRAGRQQASSDFVRGAVDDSLAEIGKQLPDGVTGNEAVKFMQDAMSQSYDDALLGMQLLPDEQLMDDIARLAEDVNGGSITTEHARQLNNIIRNEVVRRADANGGNLAGESLKKVLSAVNQKASKYRGSSVASEQEFGDALGALAEALETGARRSSDPKFVAALDAADRAYAKAVRIEGAAKNASGGMFSPAQLSTAIRQADGTVRKRAVAAGEGLMQPYAQAGRDVLASNIGDSGTAGREAMWQLSPWLFDLAAYPAYKGAQKTVPYLTRQPGPVANTIGGLLERSTPVAAPLAPALGYTLLNGR